MAFTDAQKVQIRKYLGAPDVHRQANTRLESALDVIGSRSDSQTEVESILASLVLVEAKLVSSWATAGLARAEDVEWFQSKGGGASAETEGKRSEGRRFCSRLSQLIGYPLLGDAFGTGGYGGDAWAGYGMQYGGPFELG